MKFSHLLLLLSCIVVSCGRNEQHFNELKSVYVVKPTGGESGSIKHVNGVVEEQHNVSLGFKTPGQISRIYVREGDRVRAGQLLAELDDADYRLGVEALQIQYDQLSDEVARAKRLLDKRSMSVNDFEKASAGLRQLGVQLQVNKNKLAYTKLYAPSAGLVEKVNFSAAEMVDAGTAVINMLSAKGLEVECDIPASLYLERSRFGEIYCRAAHSGSGPYQLKIVSIVPKADSNQLYRMVLAFVSPVGQAVTPGMNVEVSIPMIEDGNAALSVPLSAVFRHGNEDCVWVMRRDSTVVMQKVTIEGQPDGSDVRVTSGLTGDESIVRAGVSMLHQGEKVKVIEKPSETNAGAQL